MYFNRGYHDVGDAVVVRVAQAHEVGRDGDVNPAIVIQNAGGDAGDDAGADLELTAVGGQWAQLEERGVRVEHVGDALADRELAPAAEPLGPLRTAAGLGLVTDALGRVIDDSGTPSERAGSG